MNTRKPNKPHSFLSFTRSGDRVLDSQGRDVVDLAKNHRFSVSKVALILGMTIYQLKAALEKTVGIGPKEYFRNHRAVLARKMIQEGIGLMEISDQLGFRYYTHFAAEIRTYYGVSPRDLQRTITQSTQPLRSESVPSEVQAQPAVVI